jgi:molecular chaperone GrpE
LEEEKKIDETEQTNSSPEETSSPEEEQRDERDIKIEELEAKLKEADDKYIRVFAEFENYKKRLEKEKAQAIEYSSEKFAKDLLPILDNLQMAINSANENHDVDKLQEGVELTLRNFLTMLEKNGVEKISTEDGYDPNFHEAVMRVDSDEVESGDIAQVLQEGYRLKDRVLRATMVSVAN